jgi:pentapeptide MXKDX repeat protein
LASSGVTGYFLTKEEVDMKFFITAAIAATLALSGSMAYAQASDAMAHDSMSKDSMSKDSMSKDSMSKDSMSKDAMSKDSMSKGAMSHDSMGKTDDKMKKDATAQ